MDLEIVSEISKLWWHDMEVFIVDDGGREAPSVERMFKDEGFDIVDDIYDASFVVFVGGEDVHPRFYNQKIHPTTSPNEPRDIREIDIYNECFSLGIPMVGICRGGQLLNVMSGGNMYQHCDNHELSGTHKVITFGYEQNEVEVNSVHHQQMVPDWHKDFVLLMKAGNSTFRESMSSADTSFDSKYVNSPATGSFLDIEGLWYPHTRSLCFQPHPEYGHIPTKDLFFFYLNKYILNEGEV
jgi:GMP synthase-like glutamine amidotransferase